MVFLSVAIAVVMVLFLTNCAAPPAAPPPPSPATPRPAGSPVPSPKPPSTQLEKVRQASPTRGATYAHFYVGLAKGFYKEEGVDLQGQMMKGDVAVAAIISGGIEFSSGAGPLLQAAARGAPVRTVMMVQNAPPWYVMTRPEIRSVQDLKGKKIGVGTARTATQFSMMKVLQKNGLDPNKDAVFLGLGGDTTVRSGALKSGAVDALLETAPAHFVLKKEGFNELMKVSDGAPEWPTNSLGTSIKKIKDNSDMVKRVIRATLKSMIFIKNNKAETVDILMKELADLGLEKQLMEAAYDDTVGRYTTDGTMSEQGTVIEFATLKEFGEKVEVPKVSSLVDYSLLQEVQKELKLR